MSIETSRITRFHITVKPVGVFSIDIDQKAVYQNNIRIIIVFNGNIPMFDAIDRKLLTELQSDCRQSITDISEKVGLSPSACHRRIGILENKGVIERYAARLNGEKLGYNMTFYVEVSLEGQSETILSEFEKAALGRPEVLECHLMTGDADYLLKVAAPSTTDYERIYRRTIAALPHVSRIKSSLVMKTVKRWYGYPPNPDKL